MLNEGLTLMLTGMTTVFSFLVILWIAVSVMGKVVAKLNEIFPEPVAQAKSSVKAVSDDIGTIIAIAAAKMKQGK